jgi:uncharacterized membrane protein
LRFSSELGKHLLTLARQEHPELMKAFEASFEEGGHNEEDFDLEFFLENAAGIVEEHLKQQPPH